MATSKTVLITGANRGIGLAFAKHYTKEGWKVIVSARNVEAATELKALKPFKLVPLDTTDEPAIVTLGKELANEPIDLLINNAGILTDHGLMDTTKEELMKQFEVNAVGPFLVTRALLPSLRLAVKIHGQAFVGNITSRMGSLTDNTSGAYYGYRTSKTALNMIVTNLVMDLKPEKIGCLLLHPGYVDTDMTGHAGSVSPDDSVAGLTKIIKNATLDDAGKFFHFQGEVLPW